MAIRKIRFSTKAREHREYWKKTNNKKNQERISKILKAILEDPFRGIGKPEPLKYNLSGKWSRHIDMENRIIYTVKEDILYIYSLKGHYIDL